MKQLLLLKPLDEEISILLSQELDINPDPIYLRIHSVSEWWINNMDNIVVNKNKKIFK